MTANSLRIDWEAVAYASGYDVFRQDGEKWTYKGNVSTFSFEDAGLNSETTYTYRVFATAGSYTSENYAEIIVTTATTPTDTILPPYNLRVISNN